MTGTQSTRTRRRSIAPALLTTLAISAGCSANSTGDEGAGQINVVITSTGAGPIPATVSVVVDAKEPTAVPSNGSRTIGGLPDGPHSVRLSEVPPQCTADWYAPQSITTTAGETSAALFALHCPAPIRGAVTYQVGSQAKLYSSKPDGTEERQLAWLNGGYQQSLSRSGTRIVFTAQNSIWAIHVDGAGLLRLTPDTYVERDPELSPDGTQVVFVRQTTPLRLVIASADGREERVVHTSTEPAGTSASLGGPRWSPDGSRIVFTEGKVVYIMELSTGALTNVRPPTSTSFGLYPAWSPDGTKLVYAVVPAFSGVTIATNLAIMNLATRVETPIVASFAGSQSPDWSPDGSRILFTANSRIFGVNPDGSDLRPFTQLSRVETTVRWSPP